MNDAAGPLRIASFGFRSFPPRAGSAGADKYVLELLPRLAARGHKVTAYERIYPGETAQAAHEHLGVTVRAFRTFRKSGAEALWHSAQVVWDIIRHNRADVVHMQNGGNSPFAIPLRLFGKKTFLSEDGKEWERGKWSGVGKAYLQLTILISAFIHNQIIFDNIFIRAYFEARFKKKYAFIPFGADVSYSSDSETILGELGLERDEYFLFVGRFIPDKGLHYLIPAFERLKTDKKLVLIGDSPHPSDYARQIKSTADPRIRFPGFLYGGAVHALMANCYAYIQPSDLEGLSPVILESAFLGAPIICSDLQENRYGLEEHGIYFKRSDTDDLFAVLNDAIEDPERLKARGRAQTEHVRATFSWDRVVDEHVAIFRAN